MENIEGTDYPGTTGRRQSGDGSRGRVQIGSWSIHPRPGQRPLLSGGRDGKRNKSPWPTEICAGLSPKRKNIRHIKSRGLIAGEVHDKALDGKRVTNADVRRELKSLLEN